MTVPDAIDHSTLDPEDMLGIVRRSPAQWRRALEVASADLAPTRPRPRAVIVAGMGGSGIAGDVARLAAETDGRAPIHQVKGYRLPAWAGQDTPLLAVSHSGNTEETLAVVAEALAAGVPVHAVTSGGALGALADEGRLSATRIDGGLQPRASLPSLVTPVLLTLEQWDVLDGAADAVSAATAATSVLAAADEDGSGPARGRARRLLGSVPVFVGGRGVGSLVAARGAAQVAENAEVPAFAGELPEFDHNAIVGFATANESAPFTLVSVRDPREHPRVEARFAPTLEGIDGGVRSVEELRLVEGEWLTRLACGVLEVDLLSVHLALELHRDPTPVDAITKLKQTLAGAS